MELNDVEEDILTADKGLTELVTEFTKEKATLVEGVIPKMAEQFRREVTENQSKIRGAIRNLVSEVPLPSQTEDIGSALNSLVEEYICSEIGMKYDRLSPQLFKLKRKITIDRRGSYSYDNKKIDLAIPLFANVGFGESVWELRDAYDDKRNKYEINITAKVPPITREAKEKAKQARADYMEICSRALRKQSIGDILLRDLDSVASLDLRTYWIPSLSELNVDIKEINRDPLLVAKIYSRHYLVAKWDVRGEEPFEHYVKEFTEEKARS